MEDVYHTIAWPARHEIKVKASRFIGECAEAGTPSAALEFLAGIRRREHAATHHCFAYTVGLSEGAMFKYSDDGEPSGTAGRPIYDAVIGRGLANTIVVVTRYFGGTKLGPGGLARAYSETAAGALDAAGTRANYLTERLEVGIEFPLYDLVAKAMHQHEAQQVEAEFTDRVRLVIAVRRSRAVALRRDIVQISGGKATIAADDDDTA